MKKIVLVLAMVALTFGMNAQERVNKVLPKFESVGNSINSSTSWTLDSLGQWNEGTSSTQGSFTGIFFTKINVKGEDFYILNVEFLDGYYKYPSIKKGFTTVEMTRSFIYNEAEFLQLKSFKTVNSKLKYVYSGNATDASAAKRTIEVIKMKKKALRSQDGRFRISAQDNNIVRFILPNKHNVYSDIGFEKSYYEMNADDFSKLFEIN
jgi:hypothetical protein